MIIGIWLISNDRPFYFFQPPRFQQSFQFNFLSLFVILFGLCYRNWHLTYFYVSMIGYLNLCVGMMERNKWFIDMKNILDRCLIL